MPDNEQHHREQLIQLGIQMYQAEWAKHKFDDMCALRLEQAYAQISAGIQDTTAINDELFQNGLLYSAKALYLLKRGDQALILLDKLRFWGSLSVSMFAREEITRGLIYLQQHMQEEAVIAFNNAKNTKIEAYAELASDYLEQLESQSLSYKR